MTTSVDPVVVIPCFNEEERLDFARLAELCSTPMRVLFVDDGSSDGTAALIEKHAAREPRIELLILDHNVGKAEAVRVGMLQAVGSGAPIVGYLDADLATPPNEYIRLVNALREDPQLHGAIGSRVSLLGTDIHRSPARHYLGRMFATAASLVVGANVYDTQCGAKAFRATEWFADALAEPFTSRWAFDIELLKRLLSSGPAACPIREVPLGAWQDVGGSKLTRSSMLGAGRDLVRLAEIPRRISSALRS
ncbi:MAG: dolichyl-phosphate beta-glucosyltransferase [Candidatus Poriferisodalaceae bacterium]|jgi:dolichyl-phosphate beta-glucosyltransferase